MDPIFIVIGIWLFSIPAAVWVYDKTESESLSVVVIVLCLALPAVFFPDNPEGPLHPEFKRPDRSMTGAK